MTVPMPPVAVLWDISSGGVAYSALAYWCPGCEVLDDKGQRADGLHMLPISDTGGRRPMWTFDGNLAAPTLSPSIKVTMSRAGVTEFVCHSILRAGRLRFLADSTHELALHDVPLPPLPAWALAKTDWKHMEKQIVPGEEEFLTDLSALLAAMRTELTEKIDALRIEIDELKSRQSGSALDFSNLERLVRSIG